MNDVQIETAIAATPQAVYACFTYPNQVAHWLSEYARLQVRESGAYTLMWNRGHWAAGVYTAVEEDRHIAFTWNEPNATGETHIDVTLTPEGDGTRVALTVSGAIDDSSATVWAERLADLKTLLETANDARFLRRPLLGVGAIPVTPEEVASKGLPLAYGFNLTFVAENGPAYNAGLRAGDYLTEMDGVRQITFADFNATIARHNGGDSVQIEYYRDNQRHAATLTYGKREPQHFPETREALYEVVGKRVAELETEIDALFDGVPEAALNVKPAPHEWSAKEVVAHLIWTERWTQQAEWLMITAHTPMDWGFNNDFEIAGIAGTRETATELVADLKRTLREQLRVVPHIPDDVLALKPLFAELSGWLCATGEHCREHYEQIRAAIAHAQEAAPA